MSATETCSDCFAVLFQQHGSGSRLLLRRGEGSGLVGSDLAHRDMNGPLLVKNCEVKREAMLKLWDENVMTNGVVLTEDGPFSKHKP